MTTTSSPVPDAPVVRIEIFGSTVSVNGVVILHDGTQPLHQVAVQAASDRIAKPLGRPVRALANDAEGSASMIIHPDGRATDVELLESVDDVETGPVVPPVAAPVVPVAAAAPTLSFDASALPGGQPPAGAVPTGAVPTGAVPADTMPVAAERRPLPVAARPVAGASSGLPSKIVRAVAVAAALVAVVGMGVLLLGSRDDSGDTAADRSGEASPVAAGSSDSAAPAEAPVDQAAEVVSPDFTVTSVPGVKALRLTVETAAYPGTAAVRVDLADGKVVKRSVDLTGPSTDVELDRLAPGAATWSVEVPGAATQSGQATISATYSAPAPEPTEAPAPVVEAPATTDQDLVAAQEQAKAAQAETRAAQKQAKVAQKQAAQQKQQAAKKKQSSTKKKSSSKPKSGFGKQKKKPRSGFRD